MKNKLMSAYVAAAVVTFSHAWNRDYSNTLTAQRGTADHASAALLSAPVCAALWPLYWSTVAWRKGDKP